MKLRLKGIILSIVFLPLIILGVIVAFVTSTRATALVQEELETSMKATAAAFAAAYDHMEGDYRVGEDGNIYKGDFNISEDYVTVDTIKKSSGCEATFFWGDTRIMTTIADASGERIIGTKTTDSNVISKVLNGGEMYFSPSLVINGQNYYVLYYPVYQENSNEIVGMTFVGISDAQVQSGITGMMVIMIVVIVAILLAAAVVVLIIVNKLVKAVQAMADVADAMAQGDMTVSVDEKHIKRNDEIGDMCKSLDRLKNSMTETLLSITNQSKELLETSSSLEKMSDEASRAISQVESAVNDISTGATSQADDTTKASSYVVEMGSLISETVSDVEVLKDNSENMSSSSTEAMAILNELKAINERALKAIDVIYEQTNITNESALKIREASNIITSIASETNLLSLNASIEAARAGEQGRGFAVVADQIQKLAEQSNNSGHEIEAITNSLINDSNKAVETMKEVKEIMADQSEKVTITENSFVTVKEGIAASITSVATISERSRKLDEARTEIVDIIQNLTAIAEENAASSEETSAATTEVAASVDSVAKAALQLDQITKALEEDTRRFKF